MSIVNVIGFIFPAILMVICRKIIDINIAKGLNPAAAYPKAFVVTVVSSIIALVFVLLTTETRCENIYYK